MDLESIRQWLTLENILALIEEYRSFGPLPGILLPLIEAFLPFLPLFLFVMANANAFGLWGGFLYSWIGSVAGALLVFFIIRKYGQARFLSVIKNHDKVKKLMAWVEKHGFAPLFLLLCFPFTPSAIVNIVAGLSRISIAQYALAVIAGKMVMIFTMSFVGHDIASLITKPTRTAIVILIIAILWYVGKRIEIKLNTSVEKPKK
ncbi:TVP38/TMEM64 family protein [Cytobacillus kochii]|uniref:TVP38/TMEM64 family protein n=1 Tax=Cytobacillus TaxID=2675230 RepID=UPI001CD6F1A0|nr:TVP38/TMEM64 family protein [Cytobacillus kochii]MCA1027415.1 TVP38/TMEM64 family protein [Cytobacillus kochii]MDM5206924.1 TVP38/TMEM64 family protein [Cytobacillus kochii]